MVPAFRFLAYYFIESEGQQEIIADSVWVDVVDVCEGKVLSKPTASVLAFQNVFFFLNGVVAEQVQTWDYKVRCHFY